MYLTIQGLVLRVTVYNDTDALLTVLSRSHGKLTVKARGLRRKNSPLGGACQLLTYSEFILFAYKGMYTINEAHPVEFFHGLRKDLTKLSLGTYFAQVADVLSQEDMPTGELQSLILNSLYALDMLTIPQVQIKAAFELRAACISGYCPELHGCYRCNEPFPDRFNVAEGRLECGTCREEGAFGLRMPVTAGIVDAMRYICSCDSHKIFSFHAGEATLEGLAQLCEVYLTTQLEQGFSTLDFYKTLQLGQ